MVTALLTGKRDSNGLQGPALSGHTLQLAAEVRYRGRTLDKEFTWKAQLKV
jgi:hypothetical protein